MVDDAIADLVARYAPEDVFPEEWDLASLLNDSFFAPPGAVRCSRPRLSRTVTSAIAKARPDSAAAIRNGVTKSGSSPARFPT